MRLADILFVNDSEAKPKPKPKKTKPSQEQSGAMYRGDPRIFGQKWSPWHPVGEQVLGTGKHVFQHIGKFYSRLSALHFASTLR